MKLSDSIWWTRKARIQAEKRLLSNAFQSQIILLWYSFFSVGVSIYYLKSSQSDLTSILWVIYSVLVLCVSGFINGLSFKERASLIKECYENLKILYHQTKKAEENNSNTSIVSSEYKKLLNLCENHTDDDYILALLQEYWSIHDKNKLNPKPTCYHFFIRLIIFVKRVLMLSFFYLLPIIILYAIKCDMFNNIILE